MKKCPICCRRVCGRETPENGSSPTDAESAECWREAYLRSEARREDASRSYDRTLSALYAAAGIRRSGIEPLLVWIAARREEHERAVLAVKGQAADALEYLTYGEILRDIVLRKYARLPQATAWSGVPQMALFHETKNQDA